MTYYDNTPAYCISTILWYTVTTSIAPTSPCQSSQIQLSVRFCQPTMIALCCFFKKLVDLCCCQRQRRQLLMCCAGQKGKLGALCVRHWTSASQPFCSSPHWGSHAQQHALPLPANYCLSRKEQDCLQHVLSLGTCRAKTAGTLRTVQTALLLSIGA